MQFTFDAAFTKGGSLFKSRYGGLLAATLIFILILVGVGLVKALINAVLGADPDRTSPTGTDHLIDIFITTPLDTRHLAPRAAALARRITCHGHALRRLSSLLATGWNWRALDAHLCGTNRGSGIDSWLRLPLNRRHFRGYARHYRHRHSGRTRADLHPHRALHETHLLQPALHRSPHPAWRLRQYRHIMAHDRPRLLAPCLGSSSSWVSSSLGRSIVLVLPLFFVGIPLCLAITVSAYELIMSEQDTGEMGSGQFTGKTTAS